MVKLKNIAENNRILSVYIYFVYSRLLFAWRNLQARYRSVLLAMLRYAVIKREVVAVSLRKDRATLEVSGGMRFYWKPTGALRLMDIGITGTFETFEADCVKLLAQKGDVAVDVGANFGYYTVLFSRLVGGAGRVHAFEPLKTMFHTLEDNMRLNDAKRNTVLNNFGLGESSYTTALYTYPDQDFALASLQKHWVGGASKTTCHIKTLDAYVRRARLKRIDFIKCDVEGAELLVFRGARQSIGKFLPYILFEAVNVFERSFGYSPKELFSFLESYGYTCYSIGQRTLKKITSSSSMFTYGNYLAVPKSRYHRFTRKTKGIL